MHNRRFHRQAALISSQNSLEYQQQIIKQAIARNLNDPALSAAPVIPTTASSREIPEESQTPERWCRSIPEPAGA